MSYLILDPNQFYLSIKLFSAAFMLMIKNAKRKLRVFLTKGVVRHVNDSGIYIGAVFGIGFPPFTSRLFRYMDQQSVSNIASIIHRLAQKYGNSFVPCERLMRIAKSNKNSISSRLLLVVP